MKKTAIDIEGKVDELLVVLDKDIEHIKENLSRLNQLRSLVIRRDDLALGKLLEQIQTASESHRDHESKRQSIRRELATALACGFEQVTLSGLAAVVPEEKRAQVEHRKTKLHSLIKDLKREHANTTLLLSDCARFNRLLLKSLFDFRAAGTLTYDPKGAARRHTDMAFVNLQL